MINALARDVLDDDDGSSVVGGEERLEFLEALLKGKVREGGDVKDLLEGVRRKYGKKLRRDARDSP